MPDETPSLLIFLRHGRSLINDKRPQKWFVNDVQREMVRQAMGGRLSDAHVPLVDRGPDQAREAAVSILARFGQPDIIRCSSHLRTRQTLDAAKPVLGADIPVAYDERLREREAGYTSLMTDAEVTRYFPWLSGYWQDTGPYYARPPGGESLADVAARVRSLLAESALAGSGRKELWVAHGNLMRAARCLLEGHGDIQFCEDVAHSEVDNCAVMAYQWSATGWQPVG